MLYIYEKFSTKINRGLPFLPYLKTKEKVEKQLFPFQPDITN